MKNYISRDTYPPSITVSSLLTDSDSNAHQFVARILFELREIQRNLMLPDFHESEKLFSKGLYVEDSPYLFGSESTINYINNSIKNLYGHCIPNKSVGAEIEYPWHIFFAKFHLLVNDVNSDLKTVTITRYIDNSCEMAMVELDGLNVMEGNFWDFHNGCWGLYTYGNFKGYYTLVVRMTAFYEKLGFTVVYVKQKYSYEKYLKKLLSDK